MIIAKPGMVPGACKARMCCERGKWSTFRHDPSALLGHVVQHQVVGFVAAFHLHQTNRQGGVALSTSNRASSKAPLYMFWAMVAVAHE